MGNLMGNKTVEERNDLKKQSEKFFKEDGLKVVNRENILTAIEGLVKTTPNDQDLGGLVRKLINSTKDGFITID